MLRRAKPQRLLAALEFFLGGLALRLSSSMDTLYTFWGYNITHCKTESVHFLGLMNSATK